MDSKKIIIIILGAVIFILINYLLLDEFLENQDAKIDDAFINGFQEGFDQVLIALYDELDDCNTTIITVGNLTRYVVDASCVSDLNP